MLPKENSGAVPDETNEGLVDEDVPKEGTVVQEVLAGENDDFGGIALFDPKSY